MTDPDRAQRPALVQPHSGTHERSLAEVSLLLQALEHMSEHVAVMTLEGHIAYVNAAFEAVSGKPRSELLGLHIREAWGEMLDSDLAQEIRTTLDQGKIYRGERVSRNGERGVFFDEVVITPLPVPEGEPTHVVAVGRDSTARNIHDPLTGLFTRAMLFERIRQVLAREKRHPEFSFALLFVDLDRFRTVNETYGTEIGDRILREIGARLSAAIREVDAVGHISHLTRDEFAILLEDLRHPSDAELVAARLDACIRAPLLIGSDELVITASIGIACGGRPTASPEEVLRDAETAMVQAKAGEGSRRQLFAPELRERTSRAHKVEVELHRALGTDELKLYYQPLVTLKTGEISGAEALVRWIHPERGMISPLEFIPAAEECGLIAELGERVLRDACQQIRAWLDQGLEPPPVSVNVSPRQFRDARFLPMVTGALDAYRIEPCRLRLEVTESMAADDLDSVILILSVLRELGVQILLDDFGTGYSSLSYLTRLPLDKVKIDRTFIQRATEHEHEAAVVSTIIAMGKSLGLGLVAEGVETEAQLRFLQERGCDELQGFLFSRPVPPSDFAAMLGTRVLCPSGRP